MSGSRTSRSSASLTTSACIVRAAFRAAVLDGFANQRSAKHVGIAGRDLGRRLEAAAFGGFASRMVGLGSHFHLVPIIEHFGSAIREARMADIDIVQKAEMCGRRPHGRGWHRPKDAGGDPTVARRKRRAHVRAIDHAPA